MVFGRKDVGGQELEAQRQRLAKTESEVARLEQAVGRFPGYKAQFSDVWFDSPDIADAITKIRDCREFVGLIRARLAATTGPIAGISEDLHVIDQMLASNLIVLDSFSAILIGRQHVWNARLRASGETFDPTVRECQQALHTEASRLADAVQQHINELAAIRDKHRDDWPPNLDLAHLQAYLDDGRQALDIYEQRFGSHDEALPPDSSITLLMLAQRMEKGVEMIENERANLAVAIITRAGLQR